MKKEQAIQGWDHYWQHTRNTSAYAGRGATHPTVVNFWREFFGASRAVIEHPKIVDIASGSGAVADAARAAFGASSVSLTCVDVSASAIAALKARMPEVNGVVADARKLPLAPAEFDIVCSQFGIEYAGLDAIAGMLPLLAPGGLLALLLHHRNGGIYRQCAASLDAVREMRTAGFISRAGAMFAAGFRMLRDGDRGAYEAAAKDLMPAIRSLESIMRKHGRQVADGAVVKLYTDVRTMTSRLPRYDENEVAGWLQRVRDDLGAYEGRMSSMCEVAVDDDAFSAVCKDVEAAGFGLLTREALVNADTGVPLAWALIAVPQRPDSVAAASG